MTEPTNADIARALRSIPGLDLGTELLVRLAADRLDPPYAEAEAEEGWIEWKGGECPVQKDRRVDIVTRAGEHVIPGCIAKYLRWGHVGDIGDIIHYRVVK